MKKLQNALLHSFLFLILALQLPALGQAPPMWMETPVTEGIAGGIQMRTIQTYGKYYRSSERSIVLPYNIYPGWQAGIAFSHNSFRFQEQERESTFNPPSIFTKIQFYRKDIKGKSLRLAYKYLHSFASDGRTRMGHNSLLAAWLAPRYAFYTELRSGFSPDRPFEYLNLDVSTVVPLPLRLGNERQLSLSAGMGAYLLAGNGDISYTGTLGLQYRHSSRFMIEAGSRLPKITRGPIYGDYQAILNLGIRFLLY